MNLRSIKMQIISIILKLALICRPSKVKGKGERKLGN